MIRYPPACVVEIEGKKYQILIRSEEGGLYDLNFFKANIYPHIEVIIGDSNESQYWLRNEQEQGQE